MIREWPWRSTPALSMSVRAKDLCSSGTDTPNWNPSGSKRPQDRPGLLRAILGQRPPTPLPSERSGSKLTPGASSCRGPFERDAARWRSEPKDRESRLWQDEHWRGNRPPHRFVLRRATRHSVSPEPPASPAGPRGPNRAHGYWPMRSSRSRSRKTRCILGAHAIVDALVRAIMAAGRGRFEIDDPRIRLHALQLAQCTAPEIGRPIAPREHPFACSASRT